MGNLAFLSKGEFPYLGLNYSLVGLQMGKSELISEQISLIKFVLRLSSSLIHPHYPPFSTPTTHSLCCVRLSGRRKYRDSHTNERVRKGFPTQFAMRTSEINGKILGSCRATYSPKRLRAQNLFPFIFPFLCARKGFGVQVALRLPKIFPFISLVRIATYVGKPLRTRSSVLESLMSIF